MESRHPVRRPSPLRRSRGFVTLLVGVAAALAGGVASAHVAFEAPPRDTVLQAGASVELRWLDTITHDTLSYRLELRDDPSTPGALIASDVPPTQHSLTWQVPALSCAQCWLYVVQQNSDSEYDAVDPVSIVGGEETDAGAHMTPPDPAGGGCAIATRWRSGRGAPLAGLALGLALLRRRRRARRVS
jgi:hypothetical protein